MLSLKIGLKFCIKNLWECETLSDKRLVKVFQEFKKTVLLHNADVSSDKAIFQSASVIYCTWFQNLNCTVQGRSLRVTIISAVFISTSYSLVELA